MESVLSLLIFIWSELMSILRYVQSTPHISVVGVYADKRIVTIPPLDKLSHTGSSIQEENYHNPSNEKTRTEEYWFSYVRFENKKRLRIDTKTANQVMAHITFFDDENRDVLKHDFHGRWGNTVHQPESVRDLEIENDKIWVDMYPNSSQYELDLVMKHESESICFAFNNKSYLRPEFRSIHIKLDGKRFRIRVVLTGSNIDPQEFWFTLDNQGKGGGLKIKQESKAKSLAKGKYPFEHKTA